MNAVAELCPQCGLCCNGVLFGDVELLRGDNPKRLRELGIELLSKGRKKAFWQPCSCFEGGRCTIYAERPMRCRAFECTQIQKVNQGSQSMTAARSAVRKASGLAEEVVELCRALGNLEEDRPLNQRYAAVMAEPLELGGDEGTLELRSELMLAVGRLVHVLEHDFLAKAG